MKLNIMHRLTIQAFSYVVRGILKFRYKVRVEGLDQILALKKHCPGVLFLPNHPAEMDPVILMSLLGPAFWPRSVVVEHFYHLKGFKKILDLARVVPLPSMAEQANQWRGKELAKTFEKIAEEISLGENYIIYPSGKLKRSGLELLGGASFVYNLLHEKLDIPVVLVRTTGLWGSSFSVAQTGETPHFQTVLKRCLSVIFKNGFFFVPKREVLVQFELAGRELPKEDSRLIFNKYLEQWYNRYPFPGEEPVSLVPYFFWNKETADIPFHIPSLEEESAIEVSPKIEKEIKEHLAKLSSIKESDIHQNSHLSFDLALDSLDIAQVHLFLDRTYGASDIKPGSLQKVSDIFRAISEQQQKTDLPKEEHKAAFFPKWNEKRRTKKPLFPGGDVIAEVFLRSCDRMGGLIACGDRNSGVFSYKGLKRAALVFYHKIRELPGDRVGVLLPASIGAYLSILAIYLSGKTPVMLNWTAGKMALGHALKTCAFKSVLTSKKFLDKIQLEDLSEIEDLFVFLEDVKAQITWKEKIKSLWMSFFSAQKLMEKLQISLDPDKTAVFLFTSGTESLPKTVPLTHRQILTNEQSAFNCVDIGALDSFYGVLPPFHSFGFSLTGLLPILFGIKVFYSPDPTNSKALAQDIFDAKLTIFCSAPSFVRSLLAEATLEQLLNLRVLVVGAERMPVDLQEFVEKNLTRTTLIEGYGITECSPVVTLQRLEGEKRGVGQPIPEMEICVVDPGFQKILKQGEEGEICISGPCVFDGYLGHDSKPFFYEEGKRWYRSGDIGHLDADNNLILTDRLKRMMKIGAEMVSLGGVEAELLRVVKENSWYLPSQEGPPLAITARDSGNQKAEIVLFTTFPLSRELVNQTLRETGFGRIVKISEVIQVGEIPLTGTGKTHHRLLEEQLKNETK